MNEVYLRGRLVSVYEMKASLDQPRHLVYQLQVVHKNARQMVKYEKYTINAWGNLAQWASANLQVGMHVIVHGHLSQRKIESGQLTEVTAQSITQLAERSMTASEASPITIATDANLDSR